MRQGLFYSVVAGAVALAMVTGTAMAMPRQSAAGLTGQSPEARDDRYPLLENIPANAGRRKTLKVNAPAAEAKAAVEPAVAQPSAGFGGGALVSEARRYLGTNPTNRRTLWCGAFMDMVLKNTGHAGGGNLARGYAKYGTRVSGPRVGAIAVLTRGGGGHVGVVTGIDERGNPIIISGNHNRVVAESVYPRGRVIAYVMPN